MPVYDQNYRPWKGRLIGSPRPWWVIARTHIRLRWKRSMIAFLMLILFPFIIRLIIIFFGSKNPNNLTQLNDNVKFGPQFYLETIESDLNFFEDRYKLIFTGIVVMILLIGANLISNDNKYQTKQFYFSKPVGFGDYLSGKFLVIEFYGGLITIAPTLILFIIQALLSDNSILIKTYFWVPFSIIGYGLIMLLVFGSLILALSAMFSGRLAGVFYCAILIFPEIIWNILKVPEIGIFSICANVKQIGAVLFGVSLQEPYTYSPWAAGIFLLITIFFCMVILRWRIRPSEVVT